MTDSAHAQRQMEKLGRGVVVLKSSSTQTYIGWRLLGNDPDDIAFNLYRSANGATAVKVNSTPITATTNYLDTPPNLSSTTYTYSVKPVLNSVEVTDAWANLAGGPVTLTAGATVRQYIPVTLQPTLDGANSLYDVKFCWVGDVDGDGEYDFVVDRSNNTGEAKQWLQAYKRDGTLLWQMDMGPNSVNHYNITPGSSSIGIGHGDNVTVYDMDGDGKAEVIVRTANGVVFANGTTLVAPNDEVQYISIIDGQTGVEKARMAIPVPTGWVNRNHMNGQMGIVYADGMKPSLFYNLSNRNPDESFNKQAMTFDYRNGVLSQRWIWQHNGHTAEGHQIRMADVNNDGKDEYIDVGHVLNAEGTAQINGDKLTEVVHGDRFHVADIDPDRPGLETYFIQQNNGTGLAQGYHSSDKSTTIKKWYAAGVVDVGRGTIGSFESSVKGLEMFSTFGGTFDCKGNQLYTSAPFPPETIWWDGDLGREFLSTIGSSATSPGIDKFNAGGTGRVISLYSDTAAPNSPYNNYIAYGGRPQFWGDILGDWREEMICCATDNSELRIYTTKTVDTAKTSGGAGFRIYTLMHNPQYRCQATTKGYVQSSYVDYYLGYGMTPPPPPPMVDAKLVWKGGTGTTTWDAGTTSSWSNSGVASTFANADTVRFDISGNATTPVTLTGTLQPGAVTFYSPKDYTFAGSGIFAGTMKLVKAGAGSMILPNTHTFTGKTVIWDGALVVNGGLSSSPVTVWGGTWGGAMAAGKTGGRIAGTGSLGQLTTVKYRGAVTPGTGMNNAGTLTFAGGLTAEDGATLALDLSDDPTGTTKANDRITVTGNLSLAGTVKIVINPLNTTLGAGTYTLATYSGSLTGGLSNLSVDLPPGIPYTLAVGSGAIKITVPTMRAATAVTWSGSGGANWDLVTSQNWLRGTTADGFVSGDTVTFNATGAAAPTVALTAALPIGGATVNADTNYTFSGTGYLTGSGGLTKSGTGTLTINTSNTYTGPTVVNGGVLAVSALGDADYPSPVGASSSAAGNLTLNGGTLRLTGSQTNTNRSMTLGASGGTFDVPTSNSSIQISGTISGTGSLIKSGTGTLLLASGNNFTGGTVINGGKIYLAGTTANVSGLGSGTVTINNGTLSMADVQASETAAWNIIIPAGATGRLDADGRCSLTGTLTGSGDFTIYSGYIRTDMKGNWSSFTGKINAVTGTDGGDFRIANSFGYGTAELNIGNNVYAYYNLTMGSNLTLNVGALSGTATGTLNGGPTAGRTLTWQVGGRNTDTTFAGVIKNSTGVTALTKVGTGTQTLSGACTYTGTTTVSAGKLVMDGGSLTGTTVSVASGAGFGGNGAVTGNVTYNSGSTLLVNPAAGPLAITGNLVCNGAVNIAPVPGITLAAGTYTLYTYTGTLTGTPAFNWSAPFFSGVIDTSTSGQIKITITRVTSDLTWTGAASTTWNGTDINWAGSGSTINFVSQDRVTFGDSSTVTAVNIAAAVTPGSVTVNSSSNYSFAGAGSITGSGTLTKSGTGILALTTAHSFTGGTTITGGSIVLGNATANSGALGIGAVILNGGTLKLFSTGASSTSAGTFDDAIQVNAGATGTLIGFSRGTISSTLTGSGTFNYQTDYTFAEVSGNWSAFTGEINVTKNTNGGDFRVSSTSGFGTAKLDLGTGVSMYMLTNFASGGLTNTIGELTGSGELKGGPTNGRIMTWNIGGANTNAQFDGVIKNNTGATAIIKSGTGSWLLTGASTHTGTTTVSSGSLLVTGSLGTTAVSVASGATIGGTGTLGGSLTMASGGKLALGVGASATKGLTVSGTSTLTGSITVVPASLGGTLIPGTYTLLTYSGTLGGSPSFTWSDTTGSGYAATFSTATAGQVKITLIAPPSAPTGLTATGGNGQVALAWSAASGASNYTVLRSTNSISGFASVASGLTGTGYTNTGAANGTTYYYRVNAVNAAGTSSDSNTASAVPVQSFTQWTTTTFPGETNAAVIGQNVDPDMDGYVNLLEYFFGTSPTAANPGNLMSTVLDGQGNIIFYFPMSKNLSGVSYVIQQSADMSTWTPAGAGAVIDSDQGTYNRMKVTVPRGTNTKLMLRLQVTGP